MQPGDVVANRFEIAGVAGVGAMGVVYRARDRHTQETVAVKVMHPGDDSHEARFVREARAVASLVHPAIVRYVAQGTAESGEMYLVMEWVDGEVLSKRLARGALSVHETVVLAQRLAQGLGAAHAKHVVHRDLKPGNVILVGGRLDHAKIIDFGLVRMGALETQVTIQGVLVGTPAYMAPEQARGGGEVDPRTDVYALGCLVFRALTGRTPSAADDLRAVLAKVILEPAPSLLELRPDAPPALDRLVARMLAKEPAARPADGAAVAEELSALDVDSSELTAIDSPNDLSSGGLTSSERVIVSVAMALPPVEIPGGAERLAEDIGAAAQLVTLADGALLVAVRATAGAVEQAAGAARAALRMRARLPDTPIVLATGRGLRGERVPVGEAIERAAELLRKEASVPAPVRRGAGRPVRIDDVTGALLDARFDVRADGATWMLHAEREGLEGTRTLLGRPTAFVGRELDLATVTGLFEQCVAEPMARAVLVTGQAGVGKSRLRYEFLRQIEARGPAASVLIGRGESTRAGSPFGLIARALRRWTGMREGEPLAVQQQKLSRAVGEAVRDGAGGVTRFLGEACGAPFAEDADPHLRAARRDPMLMGDRIRRAGEDLLSGLCNSGPVVLVLEDLHWGDLPSVQFVDDVLRNLAERPIFVLALARPEIHDAFPRLWAEHNVKPVPLEPLTRRSSERLVRAVLGEEADPGTVARIVTLGAGNVFYLEELIRAVAQGGGERLPDTVLAMVEARIQALEPQARRLLRAASVFGEAFWEAGVASLLGGNTGDGDEQRGDVRAWVDVLAAREIVTPRKDARFPGEREFVFRHALLREAAYEMLTDADRSRGHALAGEWLEKAGETEAIALAEHFQRGADRARASRWYARAAEQALTAGDFVQAIARADCALECGADPDAQGVIYLCRGEACHWNSDSRETVATMQRAKELLDPRKPPWWRAAGLLVMTLGAAGRLDEASAIAEEMAAAWPLHSDVAETTGGVCRAALALGAAGQLELCGRLAALAQSAIEGDAAGAPPEIAAQLHRVLGIRAVFGGNLGGCLREYERAAVGFEAAGDGRRAAVERVNYGWALLRIGRVADGERWLLEARATATRLGVRKVVVMCDHNLGLAKLLVGDFRQARAKEEAAVAVFRALGDKRLEGTSQLYLALALEGSGDLEAAEREALLATETLAGVPSSRGQAFAVLAQVRLTRDRIAEALEAAHEAQSILEELGGLEEGEDMLKVVQAQALHRIGDTAGAVRAIREAHERLMARAATLDERSRASFFENVPLNATTIALAGAWTAT